MVSTAGTSGSVVVMRLNGAPHDSYFGAPIQTSKGQVMDHEQRASRKSWGDRWKFTKTTKSEKSDEMTTDLMIHPDYRHKYGTLSHGMLSKSMRYAETWLYGTVSVRGATTQRPSLFLYPGVVNPPNPRIIQQNTFRDSRNVVAVQTAPAYIPVRRSCCDGRGCSKCEAMQQKPTQAKPPTLNAPDPYDLMRKSRLGVGEMKEKSIINPKKKDKLQRSEPSLSFETFRPDDKKSSSWNDWEEDPIPRKSILECPVNPYDIIKKTQDSADEDLSDSTSEVKAKMKILRPKLKKEIKVKTPEVRLNGQTFKISSHSKSSNIIEEFVSDEDQTALIPRLATPQRPPRKTKHDKFVRSNLRHSRIRSKSSPNLSIKSILKKNTEGEEEEENIVVQEEIKKEATQVTPKNTLSYKKQTQNTLKKKKQVQFQVSSNSSVENLTEKPEETKEEEKPMESKSLFERELLEKLAKRSQSMENLSKQTNEIEQKKNVAEDSPQDENENNATLRRSYSDRRPSSAIIGNNHVLSTSPPNSYLFNDTMALRPRTNRHDTRDIFLDEEGKIYGVTKARPRDPPPPPPQPDLQGKMITYQEFTKLCDKRPPSPPPRLIFPFDKAPDTLKLEVTTKLCNKCEEGVVAKVPGRINRADAAKTIVNVQSNDVQVVEANKTSIIINETRTHENTVIINSSQTNNRVTISLRNQETTNNTEPTTTDNKTTLFVGSSVVVNTEEKPKYLFSDSKTDLSLDNMDPVEAVRRNLVPHVCGKDDDVIRSQSLMEKLKLTREEQKKQISKLFTSECLDKLDCLNLVESLLTTYQNKKMVQWGKDGQESVTTSRSNSFSTTSTPSRVGSFSSKNKFYDEKDKVVDEYEVRGVIIDPKDEDEIENIYETINEPIYDTILKVEAEEDSDEDVPPPLPLTSPPTFDELEQQRNKSIFEGASKYDILSYLVDAKERGLVPEDYFSGSSISDDDHSRRLSSLDDSSLHSRTSSDVVGEDLSLNHSDSGLSSRISHASDSSEETLILTNEGLKKSAAEIERNDSGVGSEASHSSRSKWQLLREDPIHLCEDCDQSVETQVTDSGVMFAPLICRKCSKKRTERKEIIQEIVETEEKYGRDLKIILEEFYKPMLVAGLLTPEQLSAIFLNTEELFENSEQLSEKLKDSLEIAIDQGDEDLLTVNIGKLFLESAQMLHAFESYCTRQASAAVILANLEKEKELLRIFLRVSQMENTVLRRMNLNSFLMVPVQRVTKYPLLLSRLHKVTPIQHNSRELLQEAQHNIELHLEHMNSEAKDISATKVWRRFSQSTGRRTTTELEMTNIKLRKMAIDILEWNHEEVRFVLEGKLVYTQPTDNNWKKGRTLKLSPIFVLLVTLGKPNNKYKSDPGEEELVFPTKTGVREATLLLIKEKCGRYTLVREPLYLDKLIVCCEDEFFEIQELLSKDTFIFKAEDIERTKEWYRQIQYHAQVLGSWRRRRNALANIMINGMMTRTYAC